MLLFQTTFIRIKDECFDFLFPRSKNLAVLENLSSGQILDLLPAAKDLEKGISDAYEGNLIAVFDYKHPLVRELIWELKYKGDRMIADKLAEILYDVLSHELAERGFTENFIHPVLVPMPTSTKRRRTRGYNQTELLAEAIMKIDQGPHGSKLLTYEPNLLTKTSHTESQARSHATKRERKENLLHSMHVNQSLKNNTGNKRNVILLDDVTTSGATFAEARRALKLAGAKKIVCIAVAH